MASDRVRVGRRQRIVLLRALALAVAKARKENHPEAAWDAFVLAKAFAEPRVGRRRSQRGNMEDTDLMIGEIEANLEELKSAD